MPDFKFKEIYNIEDLILIMELLRSEGGCPWDREQTHKTIRNNFIEETYEAVEAIDSGDAGLLKEELGDVLLQVVFHSRIEEESGRFDFGGVADGICKKLIERHPHVFSGLDVKTSDEVLKNWGDIKKASKGQKSFSDTLRGVSNALPALMRAQKVGQRAKRAGMDFSSAEAALGRAEEELSELKAAIEDGSDGKIMDELGDLLFSCVNVARLLSLDAEEALSKGINKFITRFEEAERLIMNDGADMTSISEEQADGYWKKAKSSV